MDMSLVGGPGGALFTVQKLETGAIGVAIKMNNWTVKFYLPPGDATALARAICQVVEGE